MRRGLGSALLLLLLPGAAAARPAEALACAIRQAPAGLDARLADARLAREEETAGAAYRELRALTAMCSADQFLDARQADAYFRYTAGRMERDALDGRLAGEGIASALIDKALDIGPGNANNPADSVTRGDLNQVGRALAATGRDPARITPMGWRLITAWIEATAEMFEGERALD